MPRVDRRIDNIFRDTDPPAWFKLAASRFGTIHNVFDELWWLAAESLAKCRIPLRFSYDIPAKKDDEGRIIRKSTAQLFEDVADDLGLRNPYYVRNVGNAILRANPDRLHMPKSWPLKGFGSGLGRGEILHAEIVGNNPGSFTSIDDSGGFLESLKVEMGKRDIPFAGVQENFMHRRFFSNSIWNRRLMKGKPDTPFIATAYGVVFGDNPLRNHDSESGELGFLDFTDLMFSKMVSGEYQKNSSTGDMEYAGSIFYAELDNSMGSILKPADLGMDEAVIVRNGNTVTMPYALCPPIGPAYATSSFGTWLKTALEATCFNAHLTGLDLGKVHAVTTVEREGDWRATPIIDLVVDDDHPPLKFPSFDEHVSPHTLAVLQAEKSAKEWEAFLEKQEIPSVPIAGERIRPLESNRYGEDFVRKELPAQGWEILRNRDGSPGDLMRLPPDNEWHLQGVRQHIYPLVRPKNPTRAFL